MTTTDTTYLEAPEGKIFGSPLRGQHALITGATRGIGAAIAETLGRLGADLTLIGRDRDSLDERAGEIAGASSIKVHVETADVSDPDAVGAAFTAAVPANGPISILVNNAGTGKSAPFHKMDQDLWDFMIAVNLTGTFICSQAALGGMLEAGYGRIINVASTAGLTGYGYVSAYCAAKHGVVGLTRSLALETANRGITVNAVCPGFTDTDMATRAIDNISAKTGRDTETARAELERFNPQGRLVAPDEVAALVAYLCTDAAASVHGQALALDGGETA